MDAYDPKNSTWDAKDGNSKMGATSKYLASFLELNTKETQYTKMLKIYKNVTIDDDTKTIMLSKEFSDLETQLAENSEPSRENSEVKNILQLIQAKRDQQWTPTPLSQLSTIDETEASSSMDVTSPYESEKVQAREYLDRLKSRRLFTNTPKFGSKSTLNSASQVNKEDMDVQSILTFVSNLATQQPRVVSAVVQIPDTKTEERQEPEQEPPPRWSLRRSHCAACSAQWKDRSDIEKVRCSELFSNDTNVNKLKVEKFKGLKKGSSIGGAGSPQSSILASARLQKAVRAEYVYKPDWLLGLDFGITTAFSGQRMIERSILERARRRHASKTIRNSFMFD